MAQYRKSLFDLSSGPGEAIPDPRAAENAQRQQLALEQLAQAASMIRDRREAQIREAEIAQRGALAGQELSLRQQELGQRAKESSEERAMRMALAGEDRALQERLGVMQARGFQDERALKERLAQMELGAAERTGAMERLLKQSLAERGFQESAMDRDLRKRDSDLDAFFNDRRMDLESERFRADLRGQLFDQEQAPLDRASRERIAEIQAGARSDPTRRNDEQALLARAEADKFYDRFPQIQSGQLHGLDLLSEVQQISNPEARKIVADFLMSPAMQSRINRSYAGGEFAEQMQSMGVPHLVSRPYLFQPGLVLQALNMINQGRAKKQINSLNSLNFDAAAMDQAEARAGLPRGIGADPTNTLRSRLNRPFNPLE